MSARRNGTLRASVVGLALLPVVAAVGLRGEQAPAAPVGGRGAAAPTTVSRTPAVDPTLSSAGRALWTTHCITCHGTNARGTDTGPNLIRSQVVNFDRATPSRPGTGQVVGPFLKKGHATQSGKPSASFSDQEIVELAQFLSEKVNETMRGSPTYVVLDASVLTGDAKAGEAFFKGAGGCTKCHNDQTRNLAGIGSRITNAQQLQARVLYPGPAAAGRGGRGGRGAVAQPAAPTPAAVQPPKPDPLAPVATIARAGQKPFDAWVVEEDAFFLTYRDASGASQTLRKTPDVKITITNPMQWHVDFADRLEDKQMHDLTAYLWSLK